LTQSCDRAVSGAFQSVRPKHTQIRQRHEVFSSTTKLGRKAHTDSEAFT
jgi:hypothetical protein